MPDLSLTEVILGAIAALGAGGSATAIVKRKPDPGTPEDHERRLLEMEHKLRDVDGIALRVGAIDGIAGKVTTLEGRMTTVETTIAIAIGGLRESHERIWKALDGVNETLDDIRRRVVALDVENSVERELRRRERHDTPQEVVPR